MSRPLIVGHILRTGDGCRFGAITWNSHDFRAFFEPVPCTHLPLPPVSPTVKFETKYRQFAAKSTLIRNKNLKTHCHDSVIPLADLLRIAMYLSPPTDYESSPELFTDNHPHSVKVEFSSAVILLDLPSPLREISDLVRLIAEYLWVDLPCPPQCFITDSEVFDNSSVPVTESLNSITSATMKTMIPSLEEQLTTHYKTNKAERMRLMKILSATVQQ